MTMLQKNLRSDHAPSKNKYDRAPPKIWQMEHGHFSNYGGTLFFEAKFQILSKHSFCCTSSFNPKGNQRVPQALSLLRIQSKPDGMKFILSLNFMTNQRGDTFDRTSCKAHPRLVVTTSIYKNIHLKVS